MLKVVESAFVFQALVTGLQVKEPKLVWPHDIHNNLNFLAIKIYIIPDLSDEKFKIHRRYDNYLLVLSNLSITRGQYEYGELNMFFSVAYSLIKRIFG